MTMTMQQTMRRALGTRSLVVTGALAIAATTACNGPDEQTESTLNPVGVTTNDVPMTSTDAATTTAADGASETGGKLDVMAPSDAPNITEGGTGCGQDVDIVFVMDVSTTMGPFLDQLATEIIFVDEALDAMDLPSEAHYGLVVFVDDFALLNAGAPYDSVAVLQQDFNQWSAFTASNGQVAGGGFNSTWPENSLDAIYVAAAGFQWRPQETTLRLVIHTTDDTFWDGPTTGNGIAIQHGYAETVTALQEREIRDFSFAGQIGGMCDCEDVTMGWSSPYMGMDPIPQATGGGVYDIDLVLIGQVSLADAVVEAVETTMCEPYPPVG